MDPWNEKEYFSKEANQYWRDVDFYLGGDEHATGHLIYVRFWNKFLFDLGLAVTDEPFKKLINQGKIQGRSNFVYRINGTSKFVSHNLRKEHNTTRLHVDINMVDNDILDTDFFRKWRPEFRDAEIVLEDGKYICGWEIEKMSKSKHNVQNPDELVEKYGADTLRMYEMFLGPLEQSKPWDTNGIEGVFRFFKKLWKLFYDDKGTFIVVDEDAVFEEQKAIHSTIKKIGEDIERISFNTSVSNFMICVNELTELKCHKKCILEKLLVLLSPFAPHIAEELWGQLGHTESLAYEPWPAFETDLAKEKEIELAVQIRGKIKDKITIAADATEEQIKELALASEKVQDAMDGQKAKKIIVIKSRLVNIVV